MHLVNTLPVLILLGIVTGISNVELRFLIGGHSSVLIRRFKTEVILEVIHHAIGLGLGGSCKNLVIYLRLLDILKVAAKEIFWSRCLLNGKSLSSD